VTRLAYAIKYVADMDRAVAFYRDKLGLSLRFQSPEWSEFDTGETTLALHIASEKQAGHVEIGFRVEDVDGFYREQSAAGIAFPRQPQSMHGMKIATFMDSEGAMCGLSGPG
jgi:catechol 2,3-dioxygenase-like lactoylglutathione lyase family enzyme